jgi:hypothetical protein
MTAGLQMKHKQDVKSLTQVPKKEAGLQKSCGGR